jgi:hypothetical protein
MFELFLLAVLASLVVPLAVLATVLGIRRDRCLECGRDSYVATGRSRHRTMAVDYTVHEAEFRCIHCEDRIWRSAADDTVLCA